MAETTKPTKTVEVFFSYSHKDESLRDELANHLAMLKRQDVITGWHDRKIVAGKEWEKEIDEHLNTADIILLLVSSDFLASDYCYDIEVKKAMERHDADDARVIPIILRPVDWKGAPFGRLQALPGDARPVTDWPNHDQAFLNIAQGIRAALEELVSSRITHLFPKLAKAESMGNWPNVINIGERILKLLPDHQPARSKTAAAYWERWSKYLDDSYKRHFGIFGELRWNRHVRDEDRAQRIKQVLADLSRAIQIEPENAKYYYLRYSVHSANLVYLSEDRMSPRVDYGSLRKLWLADLNHAIRLDPSNGVYYFARAKLREESDDIEGASRDRERASELGYPKKQVDEDPLSKIMGLDLGIDREE